MAHYVAAQLNGGTYDHRQLLSARGVVTLHTPVAKMGPASSYGMGWAIRSAPGSIQIWHDGDVSNFHSHLRLLPDQHLGIVVLMNVGGSGNGTAIDRLVDGIAATLLGHLQTAPIGSLWTALSRLMLMIPLLVASCGLGGRTDRCGAGSIAASDPRTASAVSGDLLAAGRRSVFDWRDLDPRGTLRSDADGRDCPVRARCLCCGRHDHGPDRWLRDSSHLLCPSPSPRSRPHSVGQTSSIHCVTHVTRALWGFCPRMTR